MDLLQIPNIDILIVAALCILAAFAFASSVASMRWRARRRARGPFKPYVRVDNSRRRPDAPDQLREVISADFSARKVMSLSEYRMFQAVEAEVAAVGQGCRVFAQTALGAVLQSRSEDAFRAINAKRVDALVVGPQGLPLMAVEYQGTGHYQNDAAARDAVKREALRKAGVDYIEVFPHTDEDSIRRMVREAYARRQPSPARRPGPTSRPQPSPTA